MLKINDRKGMPTIQEAEAFLEEAEKLNPGSWIEHSIYAGKAAQLIAQNCDDLAFIDGYYLIEKRMVEAALRHGINEYTTLKWKATLEIKEYVERKMGKSVYSILPGVVENTLEL